MLLQFAEGDSRILMQKIARDRVAGLVETPAAQQGSHSSRELRLTATLAQAFKVRPSREEGTHPQLKAIWLWMQWFST